MRWMRYTLAGKTSYGIVDGGRVEEVRGDPFRGYERTGQRHLLDDVKFEVPIEPKTFYAVGFNYPKHVIEMSKLRGVEPDLPKSPNVGYRANNALIAHHEAIVIPRDATEQVQYEGELAVIIGKQAKYLSEADALSCVLGYTIGNDVSERSWQNEDRTLWRAKNTDTFAPMGPWIETEADLDAMQTTVRVNGEVTTQFETNAMLFGVERYIATITKYITLFPGDMIWMGTDGTSPNLKAGDVVDVEISGIGVLTNPVVDET
jgi:2-keto-4-pentenoate hydratase/2-oxohepta-3-ene-1,7-dioic acid hydratase in catechol pathway